MIAEQNIIFTTDHGDLPTVTVSSSDDSGMEVDDVLVNSGPCGRSQIVLQTVIFFITISFGYHLLIVYFTIDSPSWTCSNNSTSFCIDNAGKEIKSSNEHFNYRCKMKRDNWDYSTPKNYSVITEFDLVCGKEPLADLIRAAIFIGAGVGGIVSGLAADRYGRKVSLIVSMALLSCSAITSCFIKAVWQLVLLQLLIGAAWGSSITCGYILLSEFIAPSYRSLSANIFQLAYTVAYGLVVAAAYNVREWRRLELYLAIPGLFSLLVSFFLPESPRWLNVVGEKHKAKKVLNNVIKFNKHHLVNYRLKDPPDLYCGQKGYSYFDLFKNWKHFALVASQGFLWCTAGLVYYTLALEFSALGGNMYLNFVYSMLIDIPAAFMTMFVCNYLGRKKAILCSYLVCGVVCICLAGIPKTMNSGILVRVILALIGKFFIDISFNGIYLWSFELYPTVLRTQGMTLCQTMNDAGGATAPFLTSALQSLFQPLPFIVMAVVCLLAASFGMVLPETNKKPTREKFEDFLSHTQHANMVVNENEPLLK